MKRKMREQRIMAVIVLACCAISVVLCKDATAAAIVAPVGVWMLFTKKLVII